MNNEKILFETGATSAAVNELILYTDNTRELAEYRDSLYKNWEEKGNPYGHEWTLLDEFGKLLERAEQLYRKEFPKEYISISRSRGRFEEAKEYCQIYANRFAEWKKEKEHNSK